MSFNLLIFVYYIFKEKHRVYARDARSKKNQQRDVQSLSYVL